MIPAVGFMIAAYVITRMFELLIDRSKETSGLTKLLAAFTIAVALFAVVQLATNSSPGSGQLGL